LITEGAGLPIDPVHAHRYVRPGLTVRGVLSGWAACLHACLE